MVPTQPPIDGLPIWAQIVISIIIALTALGASLKGYFGRRNEIVGQQSTATIAGASLMDNLSIRQLSDCMTQLSSSIEDLEQAVNKQSHCAGSLERAITDQNHWIRTKIDTDKEVANRLRELRDIIDREARERANGGR